MNRKMQTLGALFAMAVMPIAAQAALVVDLRFAPGSQDAGGPKVHNAVAGSYTVQVWAQVRGADTISNEGLINLFGSVQSTQVNAGAVLAGTSGVTGNLGKATAFSTGAPIGQPGTAQNLTIDGIQDWGTLTGASAIKYNSTETAGSGLDPVFAGTPGALTNLLDSGSAGAGVEFYVGDITITLNGADINNAALGGAQTVFNWVKGTGTIPASHSHREDGSSTAVTSAATYLVSGQQNAVLFVPVPEPTTAGLIGLGTLVLGGIRRRKA